MNKIFKIVFNAARGKMMVVNEATSSVQTGKKAAVTVAVIGALTAGVAQAATYDFTFDSTTVQAAVDAKVEANNGIWRGGSIGIVGDAEMTIKSSGTGFSTVYGPDGGITFEANQGYGLDAAFITSSTYGKVPQVITAKNVAFLNEKEKKYGLYGTTGGDLTVNAANVTITAPEHAVSLHDGAVVTFNDVEEFTATATEKNALRVVGGSALTITGAEGATIVAEGGANGNGIHVYDKNSSITIDNKSGTNEISSVLNEGTLSISGNTTIANGLVAKGESTTTLTGNLSVTSKTKSAVELNKSNLVVTADKATFTTDSDYYGIDAKNGSTATIDADVIEASSVYAGVISRASNVTLGNDESSLVKIEAKGQGYKGEVIGLWAYDPDSEIHVKGQNLEIVANGDEGVTSFGILAQARVGEGETGDNSIVIEAQNTQIEADTAILAMSKGKVEVKGNLTVKATDAILVRGESTVNINQDGGKSVVLNGDIDFNKNGTTSGTNAWGDVNLNLDTADSVWNGNVKASWDNASATAEDFKNSKLNLTLANGAKWVNQDIKTSGVMGSDANGVAMLAVNSLELADGLLDLSASTQDVTVKGEVSGTGYLLVDTEKSGALVNNGTDSVDLLTITTVQTADDLTAEEAEGLKAKHTDGIAKVAVKVAEGQVQGALVVGADGEVEQAVNTKTEALADKIALAPEMITRIMMNDVRKRMGDLRAAEGTHGVWARYNGGQMSGSGVDADFHMVQVGIDTVPVVDAPRFGVAFSYAQAEAKDNFGTTDMDSFSLAFYGTKMYDNGMFVDVIGRMATMDSDIVNAGAKGKMDNVALSLSGELGWRFDVTDRFFFEPSVEATYTYTNADTFTMSNGGTYELEAVDSLVGRAGFAAGFKCPANKGDIYVRAAVVHEFMGDMTVNSSINGLAAASLEADGKDTWFEYAIGANFNVNKNTYVYADIERTEGAAMDEDWRANVGVRFAF